MKFRVVWSRLAEEELAALWMNSACRGDVTRAAVSVDRQLHRDPETKGESRSADLRILLVPPLGVTFYVSFDDRLVTVLDVWQCPIRGSTQ